MSQAPSEQTVLIVDDNIAITKLFSFYLKPVFPGRIEVAYDGLEALEKFQSHEPALIFMDVNMPNKNGIAATREIRSLGFEGPIVVITAYTNAEMEKCYHAGANKVLQKPVSRDSFISLFKEYMNIGEG